jgi:hypothetical protein
MKRVDDLGFGQWRQNSGCAAFRGQFKCCTKNSLVVEIHVARQFSAGWCWGVIRQRPELGSGIAVEIDS